MPWMDTTCYQQRCSKIKKMDRRNTVAPCGNGGIVDDLLVYCIEENAVYMLVVNASNIEKRLELDKQQ